MNKAPTAKTAQSYARLAGLVYLTMIACGIFAEAFVRGSIIVSGDAISTAANLVSNEGLLRLGLLADMVLYTGDIALAILFYVLLKPVNHTLAIFAAATRLVMTAMLGFNLLNEFAALLIANGSIALDGFDAAQQAELALFFMNLHGEGFVLGLVFFGVDCLLVGYLLMRSHFIPAFLGGLIMVSGVSYLAIGLINFVVPQFGDYTMYFLLAAALGEFALTLWLLVMGLNKSKWSEVVA
jgi:hypothetical protein